MYGFNPTLGSNYWNSGSSSSGSSSSSGTDWKTDWNTIGSYSNSSVKPFPPIVSPRDDSNWKEALSKAAGYLAGTGRNRYRGRGVAVTSRQAIVRHPGWCMSLSWRVRQHSLDPPRNRP